MSVLRNKKIPALVFACAILLTGYVNSVGAQQVSTANAAPEAPLATVVVTATKEEQRLQDVPISLSAIAEAELERRGTFDLLDIAGSIPNVSFSFGNGEGRTQSRTLSLRGIYGADTTGLYIDETPVDQSLPIKVVDISRMEVLRGPQGTLYGARSMGGTVRLIANQPDPSSFESRIVGELSATEHGSENYNVEATANLPLIENTLAARMTIYRDLTSGIFDRFFGTPGDTSDSPRAVDRGTDQTTTTGAKFSLRYAPTESVTLTPRLIYQSIESDGASLADTKPDNFTQQRPFDLPEPLTDRLTHTSLEINADLGWGEFVSSTSYLKRFNQQTEDYTQFTASPDAFDLTTPYPTTATVADDERRITEEARIRTGFLERFKLILGVFYQETTIDADFFSTAAGFDEFFATQELGLPPGSSVFGTDNLFSAISTDKTRDRAVFGEFTTDVTEHLSFILGARWFDAVSSLDRFADGIFNGGPSHDSGKQEEDGINPKYSVLYKLSDDAMLYSTASRGFRSGGVNTHIPEDLCGDALADLGLTVLDVAAYNSDHLWNYEVGSKTSWLGNRLNLNGAIFYIDWSNLIQGVRLPCGFGYTGNVGAARSRGVEIEIAARPTPQLNLNVGVGYTDAEITDAESDGAGALVAARVGDRIQQVPQWNVSATAEYSFPVANGHQGFLRGDGNYVSRSFTTFDQSDPLRTRDPYAIVKLQAGVLGDSWEAALFVRNLFNEHANFSDTKSIAAELAGRPRISTNQPRTIGIRIAKSF